jgi:hypothetical protein
MVSRIDHRCGGDEERENVVYLEGSDFVFDGNYHESHFGVSDYTVLNRVDYLFFYPRIDSDFALCVDGPLFPVNVLVVVTCLWTVIGLLNVKGVNEIALVDGVEVRDSEHGISCPLLTCVDRVEERERFVDFGVIH